MPTVKYERIEGVGYILRIGTNYVGKRGNGHLVRRRRDAQVFLVEPVIEHVTTITLIRKEIRGTIVRD